MQSPLFSGADLPPVYRYESLFAHLPPLPTTGRPTGRGRRPIDRNALLRALVYRCLRQIPTLSELVFELHNNPSMVRVLGLNLLGSLPSIERFSAFLRQTDNRLLQEVRGQLVGRLIREGLIRGKILAIDSSAVPVRVRQNNWKVRLPRGRFDKTQPPLADPQAGVGVQFHFSSKRARKIAFFWGYRNHVVSDVECELPLCEHTHSAQLSEVRCALPLLRAAQRLALPVQSLVADAEYDTEAILRFIVDDLQARPIIPQNPRSRTHTAYSIRKGKIYCAADLPMASRGSTTPARGNVTYRQYSCPIYWLKSFQKQYLCCPIAHPKFTQQKGCNVLIRKTPSIRSQISYNTQSFRDLYTRRLAAERLYSRLLTLTMQHPTVRGLTAIQNHCTLAHIATLLVALSAFRSGHLDKIRWIKSFVPRLLAN